MSDREQGSGSSGAERGSAQPPHLAFDLLNDYADGLVAGAARADAERHLGTCARCATELDALRRVVAAAGSAPRELFPADDLWPELRAELERRKEVALPIRATVPAAGAGPDARSDARLDARPAADVRSPRRWSRRERTLLAAAAVVLVALSSGVTALVVHQVGSTAGSVATTPAAGGAGPAGGTPAALPAAFEVSENDYLRTIGELRATLDARRDRLSPSAIATVERSIAIIDDAIAEARAALVDDPRNTTLVQLLSATYERKLDLLRRASEMTPRT